MKRTATRLLTALIVIATGLCSAAAQQRPNVVLIYSDDHGWGDVGYHGFDDVMTPNIDRLASSGTWFPQGYVCASVCGPSRAGLVTGVYQQRMGVYGNYDKGGVPTSQPMLFEMLKREGYQCGVVGKWHVGMATRDLWPNSRGADFFYGFLSGSHDYYQSTIDIDHPKPYLRPIMRNMEADPPIQDSNGYLTELFTKEAVDFIDRAGDEPFCLYLAYNAVHHPWDVPDPYIKRVQGLDTHDERKLFAGMVLAMDDGVGAVMDALKRKGVVDNTLVFFIGDNGSPRGQGIAEPRQKVRGTTTMSSPGPFNGFKGDTYEGGTRVPFIMSWPGKIPAGKTYDHPVVNLDAVPTVMARCGVTKPYKGAAFDGVDLMPYITGEKGADAKPHETLYWRRGEDYAIRDGDWKLTWNDQAGPLSIRLFNMVDDAGEWNDLASAQPERAQTLKNMFDAWDSALPENQSPRQVQNRNYEYAKGKRIDVRKFNAAVAAEKASEKRAEDLTKRPATTKGRTLEQQLEMAKARAKNLDKKYDPEQTTRWFRAKDINGDGVIDEVEDKVKVPVGWNDKK